MASKSSLPTNTLVRRFQKGDIGPEFEEQDSAAIVELDDAARVPILHEPSTFSDEHIAAVFSSDTVLA